MKNGLGPGQGLYFFKKIEPVDPEFMEELVMWKNIK
jgi:hypothetical protein